MGRLLCEGSVSGLAVEERTGRVSSMSHDRHFTPGSAVPTPTQSSPTACLCQLFCLLQTTGKDCTGPNYLTALEKCAYEAGTKSAVDCEVLYGREVPVGR